MGLFDGIFGGGSSNKNKKEVLEVAKAKDTAAADASFLSTLGLRKSLEHEQRITAAERGRLEVQKLLGKPGTYDIPGVTTSTTPTSETVDPGGWDIFKTGQKAPFHLQDLLAPGVSQTQKNAIGGDYRNVLDPGKYAQQIAGTSDFRIMSRLTALMEQGLAGEGDLYDTYSQSITGAIMEGAAQSYQESVDALQQEAAKGGTARTAVANAAMRMQALEAGNRQRSQQLWEANARLKEYFVNNARSQVAMNNEYLTSMPFQEAYNQSMGALTEFIAGTNIPTAITVGQQTASNELAYRNMKIENASKVSWLGKLVGSGVTILTASLAGGMVDGGSNNSWLGAAVGAASNLFGSQGGSVATPNNIETGVVGSPGGYSIFGRK